MHGPHVPSVLTSQSLFHNKIHRDGFSVLPTFTPHMHRDQESLEGSLQRGTTKRGIMSLGGEKADVWHFSAVSPQLSSHCLSAGKFPNVYPCRPWLCRTRHPGSRDECWWAENGQEEGQLWGHGGSPGQGRWPGVSLEEYCSPPPSFLQMGKKALNL